MPLYCEFVTLPDCRTGTVELIYDLDGLWHRKRYSETTTPIALAYPQADTSKVS